MQKLLLERHGWGLVDAAQKYKDLRGLPEFRSTLGQVEWLTGFISRIEAFLAP
jgi:hypothetical protein